MSALGQLRTCAAQQRMSALGQKQTWPWVSVMSALTSKADIDWHHSNVCFVPIADIRQREYDVIIR